MEKGRTIRTLSLAAMITAGISLVAGSVAAQMNEKPYGFKPRDRAGLAVYMKNLENSRNASGTVSTGGGGDATYLVCGGPGGGSTSTANSSCIILNNSTSALGIGQDSVGNQDSDSTVDTTSTTTTADEINNILNK